MAVASVETGMASRVAGVADGVVVAAVAVVAPVARGKEQWDLPLTALPAVPRVAVAVAAASASTPSSRLAAKCTVIVVGRS